jgi:hypothetical protein
MNINPTCKRKGESLQINPKFIKTVEMHQINSDHLKRILTAVRIACFFLSEHYLVVINWKIKHSRNIMNQQNTFNF